MTEGAYYVAQIGDRVRVLLAGQDYGALGDVVASQSDPGPSVTARICDVLLKDGRTVQIHADYLEVVAGAGVVR